MIRPVRILRRRPEQDEDSLKIYRSNTRSTATTYTDRNVTGEDHFVYRVKAKNEAGYGPQSNFVRINR